MSTLSRTFQFLMLVPLALLASCGGGGDDSTPAPPPPTPGSISYAAQSPYNVGSDVNFAPTVSGTVTNYTVAPALPAGLSIDSSNGRISGVPTTTSASTNYTVTASSAGTNITAAVSLTVNERLADFTYDKIWWSYTRTQAITPMMPNITAGIATSWTVTPAFPAGITLNPTTGRISGTPTAVSPETEYRITATNAGGSTSSPMVMTVNDLPPSIAYADTDRTLQRGAQASILPQSFLGTVVTWSVSPTLPAGLAFDASSGAITGAPTTVTPAASYTVTATNSGGTATVNLSIAVVDGVLVDLGHADSVRAIVQDDQHILSIDAGMHVALWNAQSGAIIATRDDAIENSGNLSCDTFCSRLIGLGGNTAVVQSLRWLILLDSSSGEQLAQVQAPETIRWWRVAKDGSYVVAATNTTLTAWSRTGAVLFTKTANYGSAKPFAGSTELRIGGGPAGASVIESIAMPSGTSTNSAAHQGTFHSWFDDGEKFITNAGTTVWVYSRNLAQLDFKSLPHITQLTGQGNWFWIYQNSPNQMNIYAVGASTNPAATYSFALSTDAIASGGTIGVLPYGTNTMSVIDLAGAAPVKSDYSAPAHYFDSYAATSKDNWVVGAMQGVMLGELIGTPQVYSYGMVQSIDGNSSDIVIATASGHILDYGTSSRALKRDIPYMASKIRLSADGASVVAAPVAFNTLYTPVKNLRVYSLASGNLLQEWTYPSGGQLLADFDVADGADVLVQDVPTGTANSYQRIVTTLANVPLWAATITGGSGLYLSPNGAFSAVASADRSTSAGTNLYTAGVLTGAVTGVVGGWLDDTRLIINRYVNDKTGIPHLGGADVVSSAGAVQATLNIGAVSSIQAVTSNSFYVPAANKVYDATTGAALFSTADEPRGQGAVAGSHVVFATGSLVRIEPR